MKLIDCSSAQSSRILLQFFTICLILSPANTQAINPDTVVFTTISIWSDLKTCLQGCFNSYYDISNAVGCSTNACLCRPDTLGLAEDRLSSMALSACSDFQDQSTAVSILTAYCAAKGYTSVIAPTVLTTGACTATAALGPTKTQFVTAYVTVYVSGASPVLQTAKGMSAFVGMVIGAVLWT